MSIPSAVRTEASPLTTAEIEQHLARLAKPPGSLGRLERLAVDLCRIQRTLRPVTRPRGIAIFVADHGVLEAGVSPWPAEITGRMRNLIRSGRATSSAFARELGATLDLVDVGTLGGDDAAKLVGDDEPGPGHEAGQTNWIRAGTRNMECEPALTVTEFRRALGVGQAVAMKAITAGQHLLIAGEMGLGNTTAAACLTALLTGASLADVVGPGAGSTGQFLERKRQVAQIATARARELDRHDREAAMASVCGLELAAMAGYYLAAAANGRVVILDGFLAGVAALIAQHFEPTVTRVMIAAHRSAEPGHARCLERLGLSPYLDGWEFRLGEGTGALAALPLIDLAAALVNDVATLDELMS